MTVPHITTARGSYYRDTLIGPAGIEITRGISGEYNWTVTADQTTPGRMRVNVKRVGWIDTRVPLDKVPNYVMAEILKSIASEG